MNWDETPKAPEPVKGVSKEERENTEKHSFDFGKGIKPAMDIPEYASSAMAIYGTSFAGKTHFAATAPLPIIFLDTEHRVKKIIDRMPKERKEQMFVFDVVESAQVLNGDIDYVQMLDGLKQNVVDVANKLKKQASDGVVGTVVIDSMTDIVRWYDKWLRQQPDINLNKIQFEKGRSKTEIRYLVDVFKLTGWNLIMTFRAKQEWSGDGIPLDKFNPEWSSDLMYPVNLVVNIKKVGEKRVFILTKNDEGNINLDMEDVNWDEFHKIIKENRIMIDV
jgi:hypothetical protein